MLINGDGFSSTLRVVKVELLPYPQSLTLHWGLLIFCPADSNGNKIRGTAPKPHPLSVLNHDSIKIYKITKISQSCKSCKSCKSCENLGSDYQMQRRGAPRLYKKPVKSRQSYKSQFRLLIRPNTANRKPVSVTIRTHRAHSRAA